VDELYILARRVLLNALDALGEHRDAVVLVGAQAIYVRVGDGDLAEVAPFTTDGDLVLDPRRLKEIPPLERAMLESGFVQKDIGIWLAREQRSDNLFVDVTVDLLSPDALSPGSGTRKASLVGHEAGAARKTPGLECALVDHDVVSLVALEASDPRSRNVRVAGPAALLVSKAKKIADRVGTRRLKDKDALDVLRLLRGTTTADVAARYQQLLDDGVSEALAREALSLLKTQFAERRAVGVDMAVRATAALVDEEQVRASCTILANDLLDALAGR
jgi:hypothetical protein